MILFKRYYPQRKQYQGIAKRAKAYIYSTCLLAAIGTITLPASALPDDSKQPIRVSSDRAQKDDKKGITIYQGDVKITQGSLTISAEKVTIYSNANNVEKIIAVGKPASFSQKPNIEDGLVVAKASTIEYSIKKETILLLEKASLKQDGSTMKGNKIDYDMRAALVKADGGDGRIDILLPAPQDKP